MVMLSTVNKKNLSLSYLPLCAQNAMDAWYAPTPTRCCAHYALSVLVRALVRFALLRAGHA